MKAGWKWRGAGAVLLAWWLLLLPVPGVAAAEGGNYPPAPAALLAEANNYFRQATESTGPDQAAALYRQALLRFERLVRGGVKNGRLYYNIGNTYFRLNDLGRAILNYKRAERLLGTDENLRQNLAFALSRQPDKIELKQEARILRTVLFWHYDLPFSVRLVTLAVFNALGWGLLTVRFRWRRAGLGWLVAISFTLAVLFGGSVAHDSIVGVKAQGVLVAPEVVARKGDGAAYSSSFEAPLHAGLVFALLEERGDWLRIELENGQRGWVPKGSAELL